MENSTWCYLLPERKLSVYFDKPNWIGDTYGEVLLTISFDQQSLHYFNYFDAAANEIKWKMRSNFIVTVQGSNDGLIWQAVQSWFDHGEPEEDKKKGTIHHLLLTNELLGSMENLAHTRLKFTKWVDPNHTEESQEFNSFRVRFIEVEWFSQTTIRDFLVPNSNLLSDDPVNVEDLRIRYVELVY